MAIATADDGGDVVRRMERRDGRAMAQFYDRYGRLVYALVMRVVGSQAVAEDLVQETFLRAWNRAQFLDHHKDAVGPWLITVARNRALDYARSKETGDSRLAVFAMNEDPRLFAGLAPGVTFAEQARRVKQTLARLPEDQRGAIELAGFGGLSLAAIATRLGQPFEAVKTLVRNAVDLAAHGDGKPSGRMGCDQLRGDYGLFALSLAEEPQRGEIRTHLESGCAACESSVRQAVSLVAALSAAAPAADPPTRLRRRLLASVGVRERHYGWPVAWAAAALLFLSAAVYFSGRELQYADESLRLRRQLSDQTTGFHRLREALDLVGAPGTTEAAFGQSEPERPSGRVFANPARGVMLIASHLPPAPTGRIYEMWLVPRHGPPRPAGLFQSGDDGTAIHIEAGPLDLAAAVSVEVTLQDETGASQPAPSPLIVAGLPATSR